MALEAGNLTSETDLASKVVLLVDDDTNLLRSLARILRRQPAYRINTASCAEEAMSILKAHKIDLIVTDEQMPGLSGTSFLNWVSEHFPGMPRIMLTGQPSVDTAMRAINDGGVYRYFTKPCDTAELALGVVRVGERQEALGPEALLVDLFGRHRGELLPGDALGQLHPHTGLYRLAARHGHPVRGAVAHVVALFEQLHVPLADTGLGGLHALDGVVELLGNGDRGVAGDALFLGARVTRSGRGEYHGGRGGGPEQNRSRLCSSPIPPMIVGCATASEAPSGTPRRCRRSAPCSRRSGSPGASPWEEATRRSPATRSQPCVRTRGRQGGRAGRSSRRTGRRCRCWIPGG